MKNGYAEINMEYYNRVYIGDEFCDNSLVFHIPETEELVQKYIGQKEVSIVLPVINETTFDRIEKWLWALREKYDNKFEVICNDIGSYTHFSNLDYHVVVGRLLARVIMHYLVRKNPDGAFKKNVQRVELDATNIKRVHSLREYQRSFYNMYSVYGHANNRCAFRESGVYCKNECRDKSIELNNTYLDDIYQVTKNTIIRKESNMKVEILFDRIVDVYE